MNNVRAIALAAILGIAAGVAHADTLDMRGTDNASRFEDAGKPTRGMSRERVEAVFGSPSSRQSPVGDPPITRWDYPGFAVFFEYDHVIHAVTKR